MLKKVVDSSVEEDETAPMQAFMPQKQRRLAKVKTKLYMYEVKDSKIPNKEASEVKTSQRGNTIDTYDA